MARALIPNSTQIPDVILDHWMAELSGAELKVLLYVARRTYGFGKDSDSISIGQMAGGIKRRDGSCLDQGTGLSRSGVKSACNSLIERGLLIRVNNRSEERGECEESTYRLNLYATPEGVGQKKAYLGQKVAQVGQEKAQVGQKEAYLGRKSDGGRPESDRGVGQKLAPQETEQETEQETAASEGCRDQPPDDAAADTLEEELVSHGLGRAVARRLAQEKPDTCRRQLDYLPYARLKTTKGAWLANAIRDEYGPPPGYEAEQARRERDERAETTRLANEALQKRGAAIRAETRARVGEAYRQLEKERGGAFLAFCEHVESERVRTARIARYLSTERQNELLSAFDQPERRLELFEAWMSTHSVTSAQGSPFPHNGEADPSREPEAPRAERKGGLFMAQAS